MRLETLLAVLSLFTRTVGFAPHLTFGLSRSTANLHHVSRHVLQQTATTQEATPDNDGTSAAYNINDDRLSLPWTNFQEWALRDNILKYVVSIPRKGADEPALYALWRTMSREVVELSGYPVEMLQEKHKQQLKSATEPNQMGSNPPAALPLLDEYEFQASGGLSGRVYGIPGVAEGSKIETTSVAQVQLTLPQGYVLTDDASVAYELGTPFRTELYSPEGLDRSTMAFTAISAAQTAGDIAKVALETSKEAVPDNDMLVRLGASTAILLAGSTAINMLSHHLTLNIFWV